MITGTGSTPDGGWNDLEELQEASEVVVERMSFRSRSTWCCDGACTPTARCRRGADLTRCRSGWWAAQWRCGAAPRACRFLASGSAVARHPRRTEERVPATMHRSGCLIATATYGDEDAIEVRFLRVFRDRVLRPRVAGRLIICRYYRLAPYPAWATERVPPRSPRSAPAKH